MATPDRQFTRTQVEDKLSKAVGKTLLELDTKNLFTFIKDKGIAGKIVEECVLGCKHDSKQAADIDVDGVSTEIKTTGLRLVDNSEEKNAKCFKAKEPVSITAVSIKEIAKQDFESSHLWNKLAHLLFVYYHYLSKETASFSDYKTFPLVGYGFFELDDSDIERIKNDFILVRDFIAGIQSSYSTEEERQKHYPELSSVINDKLMLLDTAPKYPNPPRFRFKAAFMTAIVNKMLGDTTNLHHLKKPITKYEELDNRCEELTLKYKGKTKAELIERFNLNVSPKTKNLAEHLVLGMFETDASKINQIEDFVKIGVIAKTITLQPTGKAKESMKLCSLNFKEWCDADTIFESSAIYDYFRNHCFLYVIFQQDATRMPENDIFIGFKRGVFNEEFVNTEVKRTWEDVRHLVSSGEFKVFRKTYKGTGEPIINKKTKTYKEATNLPQHGRVGSANYHPVFVKGGGTDSSEENKTTEVNGWKILPHFVWLDGGYVVRHILKL